MGFRVGFNTQPPEGGWLHQQSQDSDRSSFNTQPPEGGWAHGGYTFSDSHGFNTQPPEGGWTAHMVQEDTSEMFQHTAARRRLAKCHNMIHCIKSFNTQPPEGGWE